MQDKAWEKEYRNRKLVTGSAEPQKTVLRYFRYLKKSKGLKLEGLKVLDIGTGTGRNANYLSDLGNDVTGMEISAAAIKIAQERARGTGLKVMYLQGSIGATFPFSDNTFDLALDVTSSNSLDESEREIYLKETYRVLKNGGHFFVRALTKEGDKNAKALLKNNPWKEKDTYYMKELGITERVFTAEDFREMYSNYFKIEKLIKESGYATVSGTKYKRNYLIAYMVK